MKTKLGPVLIYVSSTNTTWNCRAVFVFSDVSNPPPAVTCDSGGGKKSSIKTVKGLMLLDYRGDQIWSYDLSFVRGAADQPRSYGLANETQYQLVVPAKGNTPHFAYGSCCGFSDWNDKTKLENQERDPWGQWKDLAAAHATQPFHLLLLGGDQIYMDSLWSAEPLLEWRQKLRRFQARYQWDPDGPYDQQARQGFMDIYVSNWSREGMAGVLATIPSIMMWDDHDICDGWGSHPDDVQSFPVMQGLFGVARDYFQALQLGQPPGAVPANGIGPAGQFSSLHFLGDVALLVLDLRSFRTRDKVLFTAAEWSLFFEQLKQRWPAGKKVRHLLVMSSVPVVYVSGPSDLTGLWNWDPVTDPQDDLIDQWSDHRHQHEREILVRGLLQFSRTKKVRVTLVCGDVHLGTLGIIESTRDEDQGSSSRIITQLVSSGVVNAAPAGLVLWAIQQALGSPQTICRHVTGETVPLGDGLPRVLAARNWLSLRPSAGTAGDLVAEWHVEGTKSYPPKTITRVD